MENNMISNSQHHQECSLLLSKRCPSSKKSISWYPDHCCFGIKTLLTFSTLLLLTFPSQMDALYCYKCLALECPGNANECESVREFVVGNLRDYYHINTFLPGCPPLNESLEWRLFQVNEDPCPVEGNAATCTAGRIQIKTKREVGQQLLVSHATVLGCANVELLHSIKKATNENRCDTISKNGTKSHQIQHSMELEHCPTLESMCHEEDFCVNHQQSVIKEFKNNDRSLAHFDYGLMIGIIAFIVVVFAAVIGASFCSFPLNRPSNLPKPSNEDANLVSVRSTITQRSHDNNDLMQKVVDELATLNK